MALSASGGKAMSAPVELEIEAPEGAEVIVVGPFEDDDVAVDAAAYLTPFVKILSGLIATDRLRQTLDRPHKWKPKGTR
jgi:hypothetical protein